jgi:hypothetical protein
MTLTVPPWAADSALIELAPGLIHRGHAHHCLLPPGARAALDRDVLRLRADLEEARDASPLPGAADTAAVDALHDLIVKARLS